MEQVRVLFVEDEAPLRELVRIKLERRQEDDTALVTLFMHDNVRDAEAALAAEDYDVILLDLNLPDSRGIDTFRRIKAVSGTTPIVIFSVLVDRDLALDCLREGAQDFVRKDEQTAERLLRSLLFAVLRTAPSRGDQRPPGYFDAVARRAAALV